MLSSLLSLTDRSCIAHRGGSQTAAREHAGGVRSRGRAWRGRARMRRASLARRRAGRHSRSDARSDDRRRGSGRGRLGRRARAAWMPAFISAPATAIRVGARASACRAWRRCSIAIPRSPMVVEIKGRPSRGRPTRSSVSSRDAGALDRVIVGGFSHRPCSSAAGKCPERADQRVDATKRAGRCTVDAGWPPTRPAGYWLFQVPFRFRGRRRFRRDVRRAVGRIGPAGAGVGRRRSR